MPQIFPPWTNKLPLIVAIGIVVVVIGVIGFFWYYGSPKYTDVGYRPKQPVPYSHKLHAGDLGMDCRYCHSDVEVSPVANVPATQTCMNCHKLILPQSEKLLPIRESWMTGIPLKWVRVHELPEFVYFNHAPHLNAGVGCSSCHGDVRREDEVTQLMPLSMSWCLDCHRNPVNSIRPREELTNTEWSPPADQEAFGKRMIAERNIKPPTECSGCHR